MEDQRPDEQDDVDDHLADLRDGTGCTEIWEHVSDRREMSVTSNPADSTPRSSKTHE